MLTALKTSFSTLRTNWRISLASFSQTQILAYSSPTTSSAYHLYFTKTRTLSHPSDLLGVHVERNKEDGSIHLTQQGLAEQIVAAMHLDDPSIDPVNTPATDYLPIDERGELQHETFIYALVVRQQLNYLAGHSRCDITFATSQVTKYLHRSRRLHGLALIQIGQHLEGTLNKGLILRPSNTESLKIDLYVDAAFACGWQVEDSTNPESVKSRTGNIIEMANFPVLWVSKEQSSVATSTMESKYTALSMASSSPSISSSRTSL